jgi:hypothetical protein
MRVPSTTSLRCDRVSTTEILNMFAFVPKLKSQRACQNPVSWCPSNLLNPLVTGGSRRRGCRRMSKSESTIVESGDERRALTGGGLNTYEGAGNQCSSVRSEESCST